MKTKCLFCQYEKSSPLSKPILKVLAEEDLPMEDWILWIQRLVTTHGFHDYRGVKIHMGRKHKDQVYVGIWPGIEFDKDEEVIINSRGKYTKVAV